MLLNIEEPSTRMQLSLSLQFSLLTVSELHCQILFVDTIDGGTLYGREISFLPVKFNKIFHRKTGSFPPTDTTVQYYQ